MMCVTMGLRSTLYCACRSGSPPTLVKVVPSPKSAPAQRVYTTEKWWCLLIGQKMATALT